MIRRFYCRLCVRYLCHVTSCVILITICLFSLHLGPLLSQFLHVFILPMMIFNIFLCRLLLGSKEGWWKRALFWLAISRWEPKSISSGVCFPILPLNKRTSTFCWMRFASWVLTFKMFKLTGFWYLYKLKVILVFH